MTCCFVWRVVQLVRCVPGRSHSSEPTSEPAQALVDETHSKLLRSGVVRVSSLTATVTFTVGTRLDTPTLPEPAAAQTACRRDPGAAGTQTVSDDPSGDTSRPHALTISGCRSRSRVGTSTATPLLISSTRSGRVSPAVLYARRSSWPSLPSHGWRFHRSVVVRSLR